MKVIYTKTIKNPWRFFMVMLYLTLHKNCWARSYFCFYFLHLFFFFLINLFIFGCVGSSLLCAGFLQLLRAGTTLRCGARASRCGGFSFCGARALGEWALERRLSACGEWAQLLCGMWDLPGPGLKPVSPELAGGLLTTPPCREVPASSWLDILLVLRTMKYYF